MSHRTDKEARAAITRIFKDLDDTLDRTAHDIQNIATRLQWRGEELRDSELESNAARLRAIADRLREL